MSDFTDASSIDKAMGVMKGEAVFKFQNVNVTLPLITSSQATQGNAVVNFPIYPQITSGQVDGTESGKSTMRKITASDRQVKIDQKSTHTTVADVAYFGGANVGADLGAIMGNAVAQKFDLDVCALFADFSQTQGGASTQITLTHLFDAMRMIKSAGGIAPFSFVSNAKGIYGGKGLRPLLLDTSAVTGFSNTTPAEEFASTGFVTQIGLTGVYHSEGVIEDGSNDNPSGMFAKGAIVCAIGSQGLVNIETERDAVVGGFHIVGRGYYGVGEGQDSHGVLITHDVS
tara:strand:+ start:1264 stop:2121 length:858 start_codon:yes stop_codon:yes gene_type:complete